MANKECTKCIHKAVCKTAESCDGYVPGCKHFKEQKKGRWTRVYDDSAGWVDMCDSCGGFGDGTPYCPNCGADVRGEEE